MRLLLLIIACSFSAATETVEPEDTGSSEPGDSADTGDTAQDTGPADTGDPPDPWTTDDDGDGYSEEEGDCDDERASVHPDAEDRCDGEDTDCDGEVDEDAASEDPYEPNDASAYDLGTLDASFTVDGLLHNDIDEDRFVFAVVDEWFGDAFPVTISLSNIPDDANYRLTVTRTRSDGDLALEQLDQQFGTGPLSFTLEDDSGPDDGGDYEIQVDAIANADCDRSYLLTVSAE